MKKRSMILLVLLVMLMSVGCQTVASDTAAVPTFDFELPEGYTIDHIAGNSCDIVSGDEVVGGFMRTDLDVACIDTQDFDTIFAYLKTYTAPNETFEFFMDHWTSCLNVVVKITNTQTSESYEQYHHLFEKDGACYDMWLDGLYVERDSVEEFVDAVGIGE